MFLFLNIEKIINWIVEIVGEVMYISKSFPTMDDLSGAAFSLAQLQGAYQLNVSQLARGRIQVPNQDLSFTSIRGLDGIIR